MSVVIKVENLSKQYRLGSVGTGSLAHDLNRTWQRLRGKEDPYLTIGEENDRTQKGNSEYVWALKDINFDVKQGEVLGIIGRNGAGKSTLLKILSRTTTPSTGTIKIKGKVASLLEVGTGFHPELSGRENVFLNGAILGMKTRETQQKLEEIVDFSGVERYIDTPVKRYSSGMYVRLAFAVAAYLEPDILIIDEVLAVGDAEFQKKCIGKMNADSRAGRTILFVSHNLQALQQLCPVSIMLNKGNIKSIGASGDIIKEYLAYGKETVIGEWNIGNEIFHDHDNPYFLPTRFYLLDEREQLVNGPLDSNAAFVYIVFEGNIKTMDSRLSIGFVLRDGYNQVLISNKHTDMYVEDKIGLKEGKNIIRVRLDIRFLNEGEYFVDFNCGLWGIKMINSGKENRISIKFSIGGLRGDPTYFNKRRDSILSPYLKWEALSKS